MGPQLDTYIGPQTPNPLFITALRSKAEMPPLDRILGSIMGLTKINYNSCNYNDGLPVTVRFAKMVGEVLTMGSAKDAERRPFKSYVWPRSKLATQKLCCDQRGNIAERTKLKVDKALGLFSHTGP